MTTGSHHDGLLDELPHHWPRYAPLRVLGEGGFGVVYLCEDRERTVNGSVDAVPAPLVAVKAIPLSALSDAEVMLAMNEVSLLRNVLHPNILKYLDCFSDSVWQQLCLVTEYVDGGDLASLIRQRQSGQRRRAMAASQRRKRAREQATHHDFSLRHAHLPVPHDAADEGHDTPLDAAWPAEMAPSLANGAGASWDSSDASFFPTTPLAAGSETSASWAVKSSEWMDGTTWDDRQTHQQHTDEDDASDDNVGDDVEWIESFLITDIVRQCLDALAYLHSLCIVHRDVKPSNIYLTRDGTVRLGDFGVAKLLNSADPFTRTFVGTPFYLAPEVCLGEPYSFGADVWALGVVTYELYCLTLPFTAGNVLAQIHVISEGRYNHERLLTPHHFAPAQLAELHELYGTAQFDASEAVLHSLVVSLVEQTLTVEAGSRPAAEAILLDTFGVLPSYLNVTGASLASLPLPPQSQSQATARVSPAGSATGVASHPGSRPQSAFQQARSADREGGRRLGDGRLDVAAVSTPAEVPAAGAVGRPARPPLSPGGAGAANVWTIDSSPSASVTPTPTRPPLAPPHRVGSAGTPMGRTAHDTPENSVSALPRTDVVPPPLLTDRLDSFSVLSGTTDLWSRPHSRAAAFAMLPLGSSGVASASRDRPSSSSAAAITVTSPAMLRSRVQESMGMLTSYLPPARRVSLHEASLLHSRSNQSDSQNHPGGGERLQASMTDEPDAQGGGGGDDGVAPWLLNATAFSAITLQADSDAVLLVAASQPAGLTTANASHTAGSGTVSPSLDRSTVAGENAAVDVELVEFTKRTHADPRAADSGAGPSLSPHRRKPLLRGGVERDEDDDTNKDAITHATTTSTVTDAAVGASGPRRVSLLTPHRGIPSPPSPPPPIHTAHTSRRTPSPTLLTTTSSTSPARPSSRLGRDMMPPANSAAGARVRPVSAARGSQALRGGALSGDVTVSAHDDVGDEFRRLSTPPPSTPPVASADSIVATPCEASPASASPTNTAAPSTAQLEQLLRAKLLAHHARRHRDIQAQRQQHAALEAVRARLRTELTALYRATLTQALPAVGCHDPADGTAAAHAEVTRTPPPPPPAEATSSPHEPRTLSLTPPTQRSAATPRPLSATVTVADVISGSPLSLAHTQGPLLFADGTDTALTDVEESFAATAASAGALPWHGPSTAVTRPPSADVLDATVRQLLLAQQPLPPAQDRAVEPLTAPWPHPTQNTSEGAGEAAAGPPAASADGTTPTTLAAAGEAHALPATSSLDAAPARPHERLAALWAASGATARLALEARNAAAVARWRSTFAAQPPQRYQITPTWVPPRRDRYFADLWESSSVEDDAETVTRVAYHRPQCTTEASGPCGDDASPVAGGIPPAERTTICYQEGLRRGRQKPVRPPAAALEAVLRWRWSCPPSSCEEEEEEESDDADCASTTASSVSSVLSRSSVIASVPMRQARLPRSAHPHGRGADHTLTSPQQKAATLSPTSRRVASAPQGSTGPTSSRAVRGAPLHPRPFAPPAAEPSVLPTMFILHGLDTHASDASTDADNETRAPRTRRVLSVLGAQHASSSQSEAPASEDSDEAEAPTCSTTTASSSLTTSATSSEPETSSSTSDDNTSEQSEDDNDEYLYTALYYKPETLPHVPTAGTAEVPPTAPHRLARFFDYTLPVTLLLTATVPGDAHPTDSTSRARRRTRPASGQRKSPQRRLRRAADSPLSSSSSSGAAEPSPVAEKTAAALAHSLATSAPLGYEADLGATTALTRGPRQTPSPTSPSPPVWSALTVVGTKLSAAPSTPSAAPAPAQRTPTPLKPRGKKMKRGAVQMTSSAPVPRPPTYCLRTPHRPLPITLALRPLHDRTRLSGLLWRVLFALGQCQLDLPLFPSALEAATPTTTPRRAAAPNPLPHVSSGTATAGSDPLVVYRPAVHTPVEGGAPLLQQMALYFCEAPPPTLSELAPKLSETTPAGLLRIRIDCEDAWKEVRRVWSAHFSQRAFMRLYLVVPECALEVVSEATGP